MFAPTLKKEKKIKHENTTMCIVHSTLRDATTPYTERCVQWLTRLKKKSNYLKLKRKSINFYQKN
jgi:hypothetical protein